MGRSFDGARYSYSTPDTDFTFVGATPTRGVFQTDGWGWNRIGFAYASFTKEWGHGSHSADTRFFAIDYDDFRHILKTDNRPAAVRAKAIRRISTFRHGARTASTLITTKAGTFDGLGGWPFRPGRWGTQTQRAYAFDVESGYQPAILPMLKPWLRGGFTMGSGDGNPNDNKHETFFQILPTPRPYARFPFFNMMNTEDAFGAMILRPHAKVTVSSEYHALRLSDRERPLVFGRRRVSAVDLRLYRPVDLRPPLAGQSV